MEQQGLHVGYGKSVHDWSKEGNTWGEEHLEVEAEGEDSEAVFTGF